jgi:uncharacterized membrane protein YkoI
MKTIAIYLCITLMLLTSIPAYADKEHISKQRAMDIATQAQPGRVLSVKRSADAYRVKTLSDDGKVRVIVVDAKSGKIISGR